MLAFRLPVSGLEVLLRHPTGAEDVILAEAGGTGPHLARTLASLLVRRPDGAPLDWSALSVTDLDTALLRLRQMVVGDAVHAGAVCSAPGCGARIDITFRVGEYLEHQRPEPPVGVLPGPETGWFCLDPEVTGGDAVAFRIPSCADLEAVSSHPDGEGELARRCIRPASVTTHLREKVEAAMEAIAPSLYAELDGVCPECGVAVSVPFDPQSYVLRELRERATFVYEEVRLLAASFHWSEREILALPRVRRARYAELVHEQRGGV